MTANNSNGYGEQLELFHEDSSTLMGVYSRLSDAGLPLSGGFRGGIGSISNPVTGLNTGRDPSNYIQVNSFTYELTHEDRMSLYRNSRICQNIVNVYPMDARWATFTFGTNRFKYGADSQRVSEFFETGLKTGSLHSKFIQASIEARLHGQSFLLLGINDGQAFNKPVDENEIIALEWAEVRTYLQVRDSEDSKDHYDVALDFDNLRQNVKDQDAKIIKVHKSRLLEFIGDYLPDSVLPGTNKHDSALQSAYDGFSLAMQGLLNSNAMLNDYSLFWYKLDGLANMIRQKKHDEIYARFLSLQMGKSILKGLAMDAKTEDAGFIQRNYGGVDKIVDTMIDFMVAETGMVRYKVLGTANKAGLGAEGRGLQDRLEHSFKTQSWQSFTWKDNLMYCLKIYLLSKTGMTKGKLPRSYGLFFPPALELTPVEIAELQQKNVEWMKTAKEAGFIHAYEARMSLFSGTDPVIIATVTLDDRMNAKLESDLETETDLEGEQDLDNPDIYQSPESEQELDNPEDDSVDNALNELDTNFDSTDELFNELLATNSTKQDAKWGVWFQGRNTPVVVDATSRNEAISKAKNKSVAGKDQPVKAARQLKGASLKQANKGEWVRERASGKQVTGKASDLPLSESPSKFRPQWRKAIKAAKKLDDADFEYIETHIDELIDEHGLTYRQDLIEHDKESGQWILWNTNKTKKLGTFKTQAEAISREKQIVFFKYASKHPEALKKDAEETQAKKFPDLKQKTIDRLESLQVITQDTVNQALSFIGDKKISRSSIMKLIQSEALKKDTRLNDLVNRLFNGSISIDDFILNAAENLKDLHIFQAIDSKSGVTEFTETELKAVSTTLKEQFTSGKDPDTGKRFGLKFLADDLTESVTSDELSRRIGMYAEASKITGFRVQKNRKESEGYTEGLRILGKGEHCQKCIGYAALGWTKISDLVLPKEQCDCKVNCKCTILYR